MTAYYNEWDKPTAAWLRELIKAGAIADGIVDDRSINEVDISDLKGFSQHHFFAGIGVWSYALRRAGWADDRPVVTGSPPCQPFSSAGKRKGFEDERHLWPVFFNLVRQLGTPNFFGEQVASKDALAWLDPVQSDMEGAGYAFGALDLCGAGFGAPHIRQRLFMCGTRHMADAGSEGLERYRKPGNVEVSERRKRAQRYAGSPGRTNGFWANPDWLGCRDGKWRPVEPGTFPLAHGAPARVGRLRGYGNAVIAEVAVEFIKAYLESEAAGFDYGPDVVLEYDL